MAAKSRPPNQTGPKFATEIANVKMEKPWSKAEGGGERVSNLKILQKKRKFKWFKFV